MINEVIVRLRNLHPKQQEIKDSRAKRKVVRAGRRGGKTVYAADETVDAFLDGRRVLYAVPTTEQLSKWWFEVKNALRELIDRGVYRVNETEHVIEKPGTENRIRGKTAWNADTLRGDYADLLILDEYQLMNEDAWGIVGAPMLLDNNGDALFIFTPPSIRSRSVSKATDKMHANKLWKRADQDKTGRWAAFHFTSHDNPHLSREALSEISGDMTVLAIRQEINAEDIQEIPGALWKATNIEAGRVTSFPDLVRVGIGVDPHATSGETGLIAAGIGFYKGNAQLHGFVLEDATTGGEPSHWASAGVALYNKYEADIMIGEINNGGDMIENTIRNVKGGNHVNYTTVRATRGKYTRAEPVSALYGNADPKEFIPCRVHHVGYFPILEEQMCTYVPGSESPNNMDALVWALTELMIGAEGDQSDLQRLGRVENFQSRWTE